MHRLSVLVAPSLLPEAHVGLDVGHRLSRVAERGQLIRFPSPGRVQRLQEADDLTRRRLAHLERERQGRHLRESRGSWGTVEVQIAR